MMMKRYKPMVPTLVEIAPRNSQADWVYEVKYDGFRCLLYIKDAEQIELYSRNLINISCSFPEIVNEIKERMSDLLNYIPLIFDGELVILESNYRASFEKIQVRGRTKAEKKVQQLAKEYPAHYLVFDLLNINGVELIHEPLLKRKEALYSLFHYIGIENTSLVNKSIKLNYIQFSRELELTWQHVQKENGEGIVAKKTTSKWIEGTRTTEWLKIKNWKKADFIITAFEKKNGYFHVGLHNGNKIIDVGLFSHGLSSIERDALQQIMENNAIHEDENFMYINPSICVELKFLDWYKNEIRQPRFSKFKLEKRWIDCTWEEAMMKVTKS